MRAASAARAFAILLSMSGAAACTANGPLVSSASPTPVASTSAAQSPSAPAFPSPIATQVASPSQSPLESPTATPGAGSWLRWKLMSVPRADLAAVRLANGKVLLVGGQTTGTSDTATVDLFDPVTNSITPVAPMKAARNGHTATLLANGRVLVVGGSGSFGGTALPSAEIYDPGANTWSAVAAMSYPRVHHAAALMVNGKVLIAGGTDAPTPIEVYDPASNTWTSVALPSNNPRPSGPTATVLADGRVMIVGGANGGAHTVNADIWIYDPATGQARIDSAYPLQGGTNWATATTLHNGGVMVAGGEDSTTPAGAVSTTFVFDPAADQVSSGPAMNVGHCHHTTTTLKNGVLLVAGGRCGAQDSISVCELFDPNTGSWLAAGSLQDPRGYHVAVLLPDGRVLAAGGIYPGGSIAQTTELYTPASA